jgi:hypothetical protein
MFDRPHADSETFRDLPISHPLKPAQEKDRPTLIGESVIDRCRKPFLEQHEPQCLFRVITLRTGRRGDHVFQSFVGPTLPGGITDEVDADPQGISQEAELWLERSTALPDSQKCLLNDVVRCIGIPGLEENLPENDRLVFSEKVTEGFSVGCLYSLKKLTI